MNRKTPYQHHLEKVCRDEFILLGKNYLERIERFSSECVQALGSIKEIEDAKFFFESLKTELQEIKKLRLYNQLSRSSQLMWLSS